MFAVIGIVGLFGIQQWAHREQVKQKAAHATAALASALKAASRTARLSSSSDQRADSNRSSLTAHGRAAIRDGAFVCFKDRTGQVAVIQPYGNGHTWQLAVTCAAGGCCLLPEGAGNLAHINGDAVFLVRQVGNNFAFASPGAEGRYLSAVRDLNVPPVLDSNKLSSAAQWRVTGQGISNALHPHKKLAFIAAEVKLVPLESIAAVEGSIADYTQEQQDKVRAAEGVSKALQAQLQEAAQRLKATTADYDEQVSQLQGQLSEACMFNSQLTGLIEAKDAKLALLKEHARQVKAKYQEAERELSTAYTEVATLQQQLGERDEDVHQLQQRMCNETQQWDQLRAALQDSLAAKDEEINALSMQVQRMEAALRAVEHTLYGMRKPRRLDRASLDAVSIHQLQAAVDNFATAGEGALLMAADEMSTEEAEALRVLLEQQNLAAGELGAPAFVLEPGRELSLQDLDRAEDRTDQGSPEKQHQQQPAASGAKATRSPRRRTAAAAAAAGGGSAGRKPGWAAGAGSSSNSGRGLLSTRCDDTAVSSSRGVRSSATSESRHRYAGDASDNDSQDGDGAAAQHTDGDAAAVGAAGAAGVGGYEDDGAMCNMANSLEEAELQQQLGRWKASSAGSSRQQQQPQVMPLHAGRGNFASRPYASLSLSQLSPVKEEQMGHHRSKSSAGLGRGRYK